MSHFELLRSVLLGNLEETVPVSVWRHHPEKDRTPHGLAAAETAFHRLLGHDLIKVSFHGRYPVVDWGCTVYYDGSITGSTKCKTCAVQCAHDWEVLEPIDVSAGEFGRQVDAVRLVHEYAEGHIPVMATIFDAPMVADKLCDVPLTEHLDQCPDVMGSVLMMINSVMIDFARAVLEAGADGLFIASQHSTMSSVSDEQYDRFVLPHDLKLVSALRGKADFIVMHLHANAPGDEVRFNRIAHTPGIDVLNWEAHDTTPSLKDGKRISRKAVLGGIDHSGTLRTGDPDAVREQVLEAVRMAGLRRLIVGPGCVITTDTPMDNIRAAVEAVHSISPWDREWEAYA